MLLYQVVRYRLELAEVSLLLEITPALPVPCVLATKEF